MDFIGSFAGLFEDPVAAPSQPPPPLPKEPATGPALCKQCNDSLHFDDSFFKPKLQTSATGELYIDGRDRGMRDPWPELVLGGIDYIRYDKIPTLPVLSRAASSGCVFCAALREGLQNKFQGSPWWKPQKKSLKLSIEGMWTSRVGRTELYGVVVSVLHPEFRRRWTHVLEFLANATGVLARRTDEDPCTKWLGLRKRLCKNPWSPHNISMSQRWITECVNRTGRCGAPVEHDNSEHMSGEIYDSDYEGEANATTGEERTHASQSAKHAADMFLPMRLLDLLPVPAHTAGCISLVESIHLERGVKYAALSYCWGDVKPTVLTTRANLNSHQQSIELSALPQCLRDAVTVARSLKIRYLWIDALCIIQGDSDDWARESATMWQLFQNAYVTIAAAASESFDQGFLTRRPFEAFDMHFSSALNPHAVGKFALSTIPTRERLEFRGHPLTRELWSSKWNTRGWVWQEQKLSKRMLLFGKGMIHFKCDHCMRSENQDEARCEDPPGEGHRGTWTKWLEDFTSKQFTFLQDKLPAISGLSKQIDQNSVMMRGGPAQYLAGIWYCSERRKPHKGWQDQLFWTLHSPSPRQSLQEILERLMCADPRTYTAPSWSWASRMEQALWYPSSQYRANTDRVCPSSFEATIEEHQMNLTGPDPTGRVGPGSYLKLSGLLCRDPLNISGFSRRPRRGFKWDDSWEGEYNGIRLTVSPDWNHSPIDQEDPLLEYDIRLFGLWRHRWIFDDSASFNGLLLLKGSVTGVYFRVGTFTLDTFDDEWSSYKGCEGTGWHNIERWDQQSVNIL